MKVLNVRNVNDALYKGLAYLYDHGIREDSRAGPVLVAPEPVSTVYSHPCERVLFSPARDANPFFHIFEALWLIAGRNDARWLDQFVHDFSSRFAEADGTLHGSYGHRWRTAFGFDQLDHVVETLKRDPTSRQCAIQMWDSRLNLGEFDFPDGCEDLTGKWKDRPCNTHVYLRVREQKQYKAPSYADDSTSLEYRVVLDITVCCRSNDLIWGCFGANAVQFSFLQEYLAARIGVGIGTYHQISNNFHGYLDTLERLEKKGIKNESWPVHADHRDYPERIPFVSDPERFDYDLATFFSDGSGSGKYYNSFFMLVVLPLYASHRYWKQHDPTSAIRTVQSMVDCDWKVAAEEWYRRRMV